MLDQLRLEIDNLDASLIEILCRRFETAARIAAYKKEHGLAVYQPEREIAILNKMAGILENKSYGIEIRELYKHIFQLSRRLQISQAFPYNMVLIGFMGSGKTTVGRYLAQISGYTYYDVDHMIEQQTGKLVQDIFKFHGEDFFRSLERQTIEHLRNAEYAVISCGGGVVLNHDNISCLKVKGKLIWLKAAPETIYERIKHQNDRPLIQNKNLDDIKEMIQARQSLYSNAADYEITTDGKLIDHIGTDILNMLMRQ